MNYPSVVMEQYSLSSVTFIALLTAGEKQGNMSGFHLVLEVFLQI